MTHTSPKRGIPTKGEEVKGTNKYYGRNHRGMNDGGRPLNLQIQCLHTYFGGR